MWALLWDPKTGEFTAVDWMDTIASTDGVTRYPSRFKQGRARLTVAGDSKEEVLEQAEELVEYLRDEIYKELDGEE